MSATRIHQAALTLMDRFPAGEWGKGLLLEYILLEIVTVLLVRRDHAVAVRVGRILLDAAELEFVPCSDLFLETMQNFSIQAGTRLSFADAAILGVARSRADGLILSFDDEFRKIAGLRMNPGKAVERRTAATGRDACPTSCPT
ncbi:MAG: type II toxin-antitoxin system VapC family toxin [Bryobacteraceae bacterium]|jgi:predicted nucleic acid-binding protein